MVLSRRLAFWVFSRRPSVCRHEPFYFLSRFFLNYADITTCYAEDENLPLFDPRNNPISQIVPKIFGFFCYNEIYPVSSIMSRILHFMYYARLLSQVRNGQKVCNGVFVLLSGDCNEFHHISSSKEHGQRQTFIITIFLPF